MRDGVVLRADVYRPEGTGRYPALLKRTPYSKAAAGEIPFFQRLAGEGFVVVVQDTRGRYTSDGVSRPHDEAEDGHDTVEWVAALPNVDGKVGMFGGSYAATTQLTAASLRPNGLVALFPSASYEASRLMLQAGDTIVSYSDGVTEALDAAGEEFGEGRLIEVIKAHHGESASGLLAHVATVLRPLLDDGATRAACGRLLAAVDAETGPVFAGLPPWPDSPPRPAAEDVPTVLTALDTYRKTSPEMVVFGRMLGDALPRP